MKKLTKFISPVLLGGLLLLPSFSVQALTKNETVYTSLDYSGNVYESSVTNHLFNKEEGDIEDSTLLKDILNINGKETYTLHEERLVWSGKGRDIYYRGVTEKDLPITVQLEYYLDGVLMDAKDILGKSGLVTIKMKLQNHEKNLVRVNGKDTELFTPFVVTTGMILNHEENSDIEISHGKIIDTGTKNIIVGLSTPGMYDNFKIDAFKDLDEITICYQTINFKTVSFYMVATPKLLEDADLNIFTKLDSLTNQLKTLQNGIDALENGAKELTNGTNSLVNGSAEITNNLKLSLEAIKKLDIGSTTLKNEINQVIPLLNKTLESIQDANIAGSLANLKTLKEKNESAKNSLVTFVTQSTSMDYQTLMTYYKTNLVNYNGTDFATLQLKANCELILLLDTNVNTYTLFIQKLTPIFKQVENLAKFLTKAEELNEGVNALSSGLKQVRDGLSKLYEGSNTLTKGTKTLQKGTLELTSGISKFNKDGIQLLSRYGLEFKNSSSKAKAIAELSKNYPGYASNNTSSTTFVFMVKKAN